MDCECIHGSSEKPRAQFFVQVRLFENRLFREEPLAKWTFRKGHIRISGVARERWTQRRIDRRPHLSGTNLLGMRMHCQEYLACDRFDI